MAPPVQLSVLDFPLPRSRFLAFISLVLVAYLVLKALVQALLSPLRRVPGPFLTRFTRLYELYTIHKHDFATYNIHLHEQYGPIVRLAPNRYSINDAEAAKNVLGHQNALDKSGYYFPFGSPFATNSFSEPSIREHAKLRRPSAGLYSNTQLLSYEPFVDTCNNILLKRLREYASNQKDLDVRELMQFYAFDVIGEITMGSRFGLMEDGGDKFGIISAIDEGNVYAANVGYVPKLHTILGHVTNLLGINNSIVRIIDFVTSRVDDRVNGRTKSPSDRQDFIDKMLLLETAGKATRNSTLLACLQNVTAGSDTTAISLAATFAYLIMNPSCLATLRAELEDAATKGELSDPATFKQAQKLPYLQAVIQESLRLHPAVGAPMTRVVGPGGATLAGQFFPAGTEVGINSWVIHRNKSIFGPDAHVFRPERWLTSDPQERAHLERNFLAFGAGPRVCIGKNISLLEMCKVVPQIVRRFDFEMVNGGAGEEKGKGGIGGTGYTWKTYWFTKQDFRCFVREREKR
ncbi:pisatin demethylase [Paraphoma chrysanthemicola]|uniref:Pisatin demethylase n=1 Tax=Paraphoma chrysanthemicola TaxID=798071 RepID=A0A8K0QUT7_9PLEO|nr:pisatin demethylase [Paraphoma chrysanthemicola]